MITKNPMQLKAFIKNKAAEKPYKNTFILKGGFLISAIVGLDTRATMDLDTTIKGFTLTHEAIRKIFTEICAVQIADDVQFEVVGISDIRETDDYPGIRVALKANKTLKPELSLKIQRLLPDYMMKFLNTLKATLLLTLMMTSIYSDCSLLT